MRYISAPQRSQGTRSAGGSAGSRRSADATGVTGGFDRGSGIGRHYSPVPAPGAASAIETRPADSYEDESEVVWWRPD